MDLETRLGHVFGMVEEAAVQGFRCPTNEELREAFRKKGFLHNATATACPPNSLATLARRGKIRVEIYGRNWRVAEILTGIHRGKRTLGSPHGDLPYLVFTSKGKQRVEI